MKINLNLGLHQSAHECYALYWATPVALGALVALVYSTSFALRDFREYRRVHRSVTECEAQERALQERERAALRRLQQPQFQGVLRQANYLNSLIERRQLSLTGLTATLTRLLPADVRLTTLSLAEGSEGLSVRMTIESGNQQKVIAFVQNLEESHDFSEPVISSEDPGPQGGGSASGGAARLICTARYVGWHSPGGGSTARSQEPVARRQKKGMTERKSEAETQKQNEKNHERQEERR
jgi:hypothetical protein